MGILFRCIILRETYWTSATRRSKRVHIRLKGSDLERIDLGPRQLACNLSSNWSSMCQEYHAGPGAGMGVWWQGFFHDSDWVVVSGLGSCGVFIAVSGLAYFAAHLGGDESAITLYEDPIREWVAKINGAEIFVFGGSPNNDQPLEMKWAGYVRDFTGTSEDHIMFYFGLDSTGLAVNKSRKCGRPNIVATAPRANAAVHRRGKCTIL